jgi:hypothetical protein
MTMPACKWYECSGESWNIIAKQSVECCRNICEHLVQWIDFETIIALISMIYVVDLDAYEIHPEDEKVFIDEC